MLFEDLPNDVLCEILRWTGAPSIHCGILRHVSRGFARQISPGKYLVWMCERIVKTPYTALMDWAISAGYKIGQDICNSADEVGNLVMLKHLRGLGFVWDASLESSAWRGHLEIIQYGVENGYPIGMSMPHAADSGYVEICHWLVARGEEIDDYTCLCAVKSTQEVVVCWIIEVQPNCSGWLLKDAYNSGNVKIAKLLYEMGYFHYELLMRAIRDNGYLELLQWYVDIGGVIDRYDALEAAESGHLHFLQWFKEIGFVIDYNGCIDAAEEYGHTECVEWLRANRS